MRRQYKHPKTLEQDLYAAQNELSVVTSERNELRDALDDSLADLDDCRSALRACHGKVLMLGKVVKGLLKVVSQKGIMQEPHIELLSTLIEDYGDEDEAARIATEELQRVAKMVSQPFVDEALLGELTAPEARIRQMLDDAKAPMQDAFEAIYTLRDRKGKMVLMKKRGAS